MSADKSQTTDDDLWDRGATAVTALSAGHRTAGGWIKNPENAIQNLGINEIGTATGTSSSGSTVFIVPGETYQLAASGNIVSRAKEICRLADGSPCAGPDTDCEPENCKGNGASRQGVQQAMRRPKTTSHASIWLQPEEGSDEEIGPSWFNVNIWGSGATEYVRRDLYDALADKYEALLNQLGATDE